MTMMAMTQAKIGRFMKKRGMKRLLYFLAAEGWGAAGDAAGCAAGGCVFAGWAAAAAGAAAGLLPNGTALTAAPGRAL
jgi:hypothetical protein